MEIVVFKVTLHEAYRETTINFSSMQFHLCPDLIEASAEDETRQKNVHDGAGQDRTGQDKTRQIKSHHLDVLYVLAFSWPSVLAFEREPCRVLDTAQC